MNDLVGVASRSASEGTNFRRFLADRGVVHVKEFRPIGQCKGRFGDSLRFETMLLTVLKGSKKKTSYGVRIEHYGRDGDQDASVFLDFDEIDELLEAIRFIRSTAQDLSLQQRDHTEIQYSTKDEAKVGYYQTSDDQQAFASIGRATMFFEVKLLSEIAALIAKAKDHLVSCGAAEVES